MGGELVNAALSVKLTIKETSGISRSFEPVTSGIPIAEESNITNQDLFCIKDSNGNVVPAQFRILERWDTAADNSLGKIKWVLVDFQANVSANSDAFYYLQDCGETTSFPPLNVTNVNDVITINTGNAEFVINKNNFGILTSAKYDGVAVLNAGDISEDDGTIYLSSNGVADVFEIEEQGPMRVVIHVEGYNVDSLSNNGLRYVARIHFYAGKPYTRVVYYYIHDQNLADATMNEPSQVQQVDRTINDLEINFNLNCSVSSSYLIGRGNGVTPWTGVISGEDKYCRQTSFNQYDSFEENGTGQLLGWANFYDNNKGMVIAVKNFYNKWPHGIRLALNGDFSYEVLPIGAGESGGLHDLYTAP